MNSKFKITIPKPCHENWNKMSPKEKGRFCNSCAKTVVDFTKKSSTEIQDYLIEHKNKRVCGHFYKKQLDTIVIKIPQITFQQQLSYQKLFILALFFVMGTTLFSCQYTDGKKQKIENVIIKDSIEIIEEDLGVIFPIENSIGSLKILKSKDSTFIQIPYYPVQKKDDILINHNLTAIGDILEVTDTIGGMTVEGGISYTEIKKLELQETFGFVIIEEAPRFKEGKSLSKEKAKKDFDKRIQSFVQGNFDAKITQGLDLPEGKYKIQAQFTIDENGNITDIKVRAPHPKLKDEVIKMLKKLPQFIPGKQAGKVVKTKYTLPISFEVD